MGNSCTMAARENVSMPSRVMIISQKNTTLRHRKNGSGANSSILQKLTAVRTESQTLSSTTKDRTAGLDAQTASDSDENRPSHCMLRPVSLRYDLEELGIGEYYLEQEFFEVKARRSSKRKSQRDGDGDWDAVIVLMRSHKTTQMPTQQSLLTETDVYLKEFAFQKPKIYYKMLRRGPPMRYRWPVWKTSLELDKFYIPDLYEKLKKLSSQWESVIRKDLHRTFPNEPYFASMKHGNIGQDHLFNTLKAVSIYFPNIGYLQGMNFVMGFMLLLNGGDEVEAFWMFVTLARDHRYFMMGFFEQGFPLLDFYIYMFYNLLEEELPEVHDHIKQLQLPDQLWVFKWFLTVFIYNVPQVHEVRIWDFVMSYGLFSVVQLAVGILKFFENEILELDAVGIDQFLRHLRGEDGRVKKAAEVINVSVQKGDQSNRNVDHSVLHHQQSHHSPSHQQSIHRPTVDGENHISMGHEVSDFQYTFPDVDIEEILRIAEKIPFSLEKVAELAQTFVETTTKKLPDFYVRYLKNLGDYHQDFEKQTQLQRDVDLYILNSELSTKPNEEIVVSNLINDVDNVNILNDICF